MVSTRHHPREFPPPDASPTKGSPRKSSRNSTASPAPGSPDLDSSPSQSLAKRAVSNSIALSSPTSLAPSGPWSHTVSNVTVAWITISLPLVIWDVLYILLRPHTMADGFLQWPIWKPYEIYASIDYVYGWPGYKDLNGFAGGQAWLNGIECILYGLYVMIVWEHGVPSREGSGVQVDAAKDKSGALGWLGRATRVEGTRGNRALVLGFSAALMTFSKTTLYYLSEYCSGFKHTAHNDLVTLVMFYGIMNGMWLVFPAYMTFTFGADILAGLDAATESSSSSKKKN